MLGKWTVALLAITAGTAATLAQAQDADHGWGRWKGGETSQSSSPSKFGPSCQPEFTSRGTAPVGFGITQYWAKRHARRHWEEAAVKLHGPTYGKWSKAKGSSVDCEKQDKEWLCKATAHPCR